MIHKLVRDFLVFLSILDPFTTFAIFIAVTASRTAEERKKIATRAILFAAGVLVAAIAVGQVVLAAIHVSISSFRIAGGLILFLFALQMLFGTGHGPQAAEHEDVAVFPLATPTIAGPGAILAAIMLTDKDQNAIDLQIGSTLVLLAVLSLNWVAMRAASFLRRVVGGGGAAIIARVMGLILASLAVETVVQGVAMASGAAPPR
jgi:multiple antibiotic resistance protein